MKTRIYTDGIGLRLSFSFFVMLILMAALTYVALNHMANVNSRMQHIVENSNAKIAFAQVMRHALHERALSMHAIAVLDDAFLQYEEYMHFNTLGSLFYSARTNLEALITTQDEKEILSAIKELTQDTQPDVQQVVEMGLDGNKATIFEKIRTEAIPKQRLIADEVKKLVVLQEEQAKADLSYAQSSYIKARNLMFLLGSLTIVLGTFIAVFVIRHVTNQARQLEHQALHDELTALPNRLLFNDRLKSLILRGQRQSEPFSVILLDLNKFKIINDSLGHNVGDLLLQEVSRRLKKAVRKMDTVARLGGDEFVVLLESVSAEQAIQFAEKLVDCFSSPFLLAGQEVDVGVSMGISSYPDHGHDCVTLVNRADIAMYNAKRKKQPFFCYTDKIKHKGKLVFAN